MPVCIDIMCVGDDDVDDAAPGNSRPVGTRLPVGPPHRMEGEADFTYDLVRKSCMGPKSTDRLCIRCKTPKSSS